MPTRRVRWDNTTFLTAACVASLPMLSRPMWPWVAWRMMPSCSAVLMASQRPSLIMAFLRSSHEEVSVTSTSASLASAVTAALAPVSPVNMMTLSGVSKR